MNNTSNHNSHISSISHTGIRSNRMRFAFVAAVSLIGLGASSGPVSAKVPPADDDLMIVLEQTCPKAGKIDVVGSVKSITITAPEGKLIAGYCVKAGSAKQGDGPESFVLQPPVAEITFGHSSGKDISHYTIVFVVEPIDDLVPLPDKPDEPVMPDDKKAPALQPEAAQALSEAQPETAPVPAVSSATTELPATGSATNLLAGLAAGMTALGLFARRFARRAS